MESVLPGDEGNDGEGPSYCYLNESGIKQYRKRLGTQVTLRGDFAAFAYVDLPAHKAAFEGNVGALEAIFLWKGNEGVPSCDKMLATPLHIAAKGNQLECIKWLLKFTNLSVLDQANHGETPIHVASALGHYDSVKAMIGACDRGAKDSLCIIQDKTGFTCLLLAISKHQNKIVKLLINELGIKSADSINISSITAAHVAASSGNVEALKLIYSKNKGLLHQVSADGTTPIYFAAQEGKLDALRFLHEVGKCDVSIPAGDNLKPIHAGAQAGHTGIVKYIVSRLGIDAMMEPVPDGGTPLHFAATAGKFKTVRWIVNNDVTGLVVFARDEIGDTPAHDAAEAGEVEVLKFLLDNGAKLMQKNKNGVTVYSNALGSNNPAMAEFVATYSRVPSMIVTDTDGDANEEISQEVHEGEVVSPDDAEEHKADEQLEVSHDYATVNEIQESEAHSSRKHKSRGFSKSISNALRPLRRKKSSSAETNSDFNEIGFKPTHRSNPLSRLMPGSSGGSKEKKGSTTPAAPPSTPATVISEAQDINELDGVYSTVDQEVVKKKRGKKKASEEPPPIPDQNFGVAPTDGSLSHISLSSSADSNATGSKKTSPLRGEKWPHGFRLDDAIMVTQSNGSAKPKGGGVQDEKWVKTEKVGPSKTTVPDLKPLKAWPPVKQEQEEEEEEEGITVIDEV